MLRVEKVIRVAEVSRENMDRVHHNAHGPVGLSSRPQVRVRLQQHGPGWPLTLDQLQFGLEEAE